ncbi:ABC transporter ATP-binding protein [Alicyclobacillus mali]|uniref:ABC transporter ATP-binding protein n=1 Tax=Alicyclobacillus mali (ex Roth et al. 2021) TaxID=1123961 RepID=A0ABS0F324_9BACL|nr:ABC transporter ATP-binding protein [Alicyclobacillus mali (ex Roth et al. 2021)]MBF8377704.1 ABC transporter ATP-binding protein [Alicyclobacillus mali (ex Roth et al. 2021)]MCL6489920.1 ABC transporter ATP-binding protein [Alicyclobacillus mali (ex Roth et al. 2021)]
MAILSVSDVTWIRNERTILDHVSFEVLEGQHWGLIGLNGSGKTSLLQIITGYQWPTRGQVQVLGQTYGRVDLREVRKRIGWVSYALLQRLERDAASDRVLEVIVSGAFSSFGLWEQPTPEQWERARELAGDLGVTHVLDSPFQSLSQGEKQRVLIARALMARPSLLILDEPCTALDVRAREDLLMSLNAMITAATDAPALLYVTHHIEEMIPAITHVLALDAGRVAACGEKKSVLTDEVLSRTFHVPVRTVWQGYRAFLTVVSSDADLNPTVISAPNAPR